MISSAASPSTVSTTQPRICAFRYGFDESTTDSATRGSRARFRPLRDVDCVKNAIRPSSHVAQIGIECGEFFVGRLLRQIRVRPEALERSVLRLRWLIGSHQIAGWRSG